jgi:hypothetical protein
VNVVAVIVAALLAGPGGRHAFSGYLIILAVILAAWLVGDIR